MNVHTGSTDHYDGWWYENEDGEEVNAVDREEVVCVYKNENDEWIEFSV
jgi:hypothetical protein